MSLGGEDIQLSRPLLKVHIAGLHAADASDLGVINESHVKCK